ncbi:MAG: hypothetical protein ACTSSQ_02950, partial [Alphaproteobacteria bacterium]
TLFALDEVADRHDTAWTVLFTEALTDYLVIQQAPEGYISQENADWLIARISADGTVKTETELELLIKVLEKAKSSPASLAAFALNQVKSAVISGDGPATCGRELEPGKVGRVEADLMRRILYAFGGDGNIAVTRAEADVLFDINDAVADAENDPAWTDLFTKALANCLMAASGYTVPSRDVALKREQWLDSDTGGVANFFGRMMSGGFRGVIDAYKAPSTEEAWAERNAKFATDNQIAEVVTEAEADWLADRIGRDGHIHENEKALLRFISEESPNMHPSLKPLVDAA